MKILCIIPTRNGEKLLSRLLDSLSIQTAIFGVFVVDSDSSDDTHNILINKGISHITIDATSFNHGGTRQHAVDLNPDYDIYVFLTQDAYLASRDSITYLIELFNDSRVGAVCGRQLPHHDATALARHARYFNYPECVLVKTIGDVPKLGIKTAFMSNSFAAYRGTALKAVEGFPANVIFAEDMYVAAKMLLKDWKVAYAGNACCHHSHNYTVIEEFERSFDMGVFHAREPWIRKKFGGAGGEGIRYVVSELRFLGFRRIHIWPSAFFRNSVKLLGYKLGQQETNLPIGLKRRLGMYKRYWDGPFAVASGQKGGA